MKKQSLMNWHCIKDNQPLVREEQRLRCKHCGQSYKIECEIPIFTDTAEKTDQVCTAIPLLEELHELLRERPEEVAAQMFCQNYECTDYRHGVDWKTLFPVPTEGPVLELGVGFGEETSELIKRARHTISLATSLTEASIANTRLQRQADHNWEIGIVQDLSRLPFANQQFQSLIMEGISASGFNLHNGKIVATIKEWRRILRPGSTVFLGLQNMPFILALYWLVRKLSPAQNHPETLNRFVKKNSFFASSQRRQLSAWHVIRCMQREGFELTYIYSPFPNEKKMKMALPLKNSQIVNYFLRHFIPRYTKVWCIILAILLLLNKVRAFPYVLPYYYAIFRLPKQKNLS